MSIDSIGGGGIPPKGLVSLAVERQQTATIAAIKSQAKAEQAVADLVAQAVQQGQQAQAPSTGTPSPAPARGSRVNILV